MITSVRPMSVDHARALAMAYTLHQLLGELYDRKDGGPGTPVEAAWDAMDEVIRHLEPAEVQPLPHCVLHRRRSDERR